MSTSLSAERSDGRRIADGATFSIILALGFSHFLNDTMQSLVPALYPMLKDTYDLSVAQIGLITLTMQVTSSFLQPMIGLLADHRPQPYSLAVGMGVTFIGLLMLASADNFLVLLLAAALVGTGSAVFHPEASRVARMASGGRHGLARSLFQVGGNIGSAIGPILAGADRDPEGAVEHRLVLLGGAPGDDRAGQRRQLVQEGASAIAGARPLPCLARRAVAPHRRLVAGDPDGAGILEILLHRQPQQLLHLLPDR